MRLSPESGEGDQESGRGDPDQRERDVGDDPDGEEPGAGEEQRSEADRSWSCRREGAPFAERAVEPRIGEQQLAGRQDRREDGGEREGREEEIFHRPEIDPADVAPVPDEAVEVLEGPPEPRADREEEEEGASPGKHQAPARSPHRERVDKQDEGDPQGRERVGLENSPIHGIRTHATIQDAAPSPAPAHPHRGNGRRPPGTVLPTERDQAKEEGDRCREDQKRQAEEHRKRERHMRHLRGLRGELQMRRERFPHGRRARQRQEENERGGDRHEEKISRWIHGETQREVPRRALRWENADGTRNHVEPTGQDRAVRFAGSPLISGTPLPPGRRKEGEGLAPRVGKGMLLVRRDEDEAPRDHFGFAVLALDRSFPREDEHFMLPGVGVERRVTAGATPKCRRVKSGPRRCPPSGHGW